MAISTTEIKLIGEKINDPYWAIIWSAHILEILEKNFPNIPIDFRSRKTDTNYYERIYKLYSNLIASIFSMKERKTGKQIVNIRQCLEKDFDNGWGMGTTDVEPEPIKICNDTWEEIEEQHKQGLIQSENWNDIALLRTYERQAKWLEEKYEIEFLNKDILNSIIINQKVY